MGKIFSKVVGLSVGLSLAIGLGVAAKGVRKEASRANADSASFVKITSNDDLTDGEYLIVCESQSVAFNGGLATLDAVSNTIAVSPSSGSIAANAVTTAATFTWDGTESSLLSNSGKYIGRKAATNGLNSATTFSADYANTISIDDSGNADIAGAGGLKLRYNKSSGQTRFRYFTSAQESVQLYKLVGSASTKFAVVYNGNGSTGGAVPTDSNEYDSGDEVTVLGNTGSLVKTGYTFGGWNTNADGTGTNYLADETFEITATITLYAKWVANKHTLTYDLNGGSGEIPAPTQYDYDEKVTLESGEGLSKTGFIFGGWNTAADGSGDNYSGGSKYTIQGDVTLYAKWNVPKGDFALVEDLAELSVGDEIAIVSSGTGSKKALSTTQNSNNRSAVSVTVTEEHTFTVTDDVQMITLGKSGDNWTFAVDGGYLYAASSSQNYLRTQEENDTNGEWEIVINENGVASITAQGTNTRNQLKNNGDLFACYASGQTDVSIYKEVANQPKLEIWDTSWKVSENAAYLWDDDADFYSFFAYLEGDSEKESEARTLVETATWTSSDPTVATIKNGSNGRGLLTTIAPGSTTLTAIASGYKKASVTISVAPGGLESLVLSGTMSKKSYTVGSSWDHSGITATASYSSGFELDVSQSVQWTYSPAAPALNVTSVSVSASLDDVSSNTIDVTGITVTKVNPIQSIYSKSVGDDVDVYGIFVGNKDGNNIIIMDGEYGIDVYKYECGTNEYVENETILHVVGKVAAYKGLIEISSVTTLATVESADVDAPVVYAAKGGETPDYASRITTVTGVATCTKNDFSSAAGTNDITMSFNVSGAAVQVFYKKATQTADTDAYNKMKNAVAGGTEITVKGFTAWYNGFQVQMTGLVEAKQDYTAEQFAQDLLDQTDAVCTGWKEGDNNHDAIEAIWSDLASNDKYPSLPSDQKTILAEAARNESGTVVEQAMARYDYLTGRYNLSNFINGRTPITSGSANMFIVNDNNIITMVVILASLLTVSCAALLALKKRRFHR